MNKYFALCFFLFSVSAWSTTVKKVTVTGLEKYQGQSISLFYVSGKQATFGTAGQELETNKVLFGPVTKVIDGNVLTFPKTKVPRDGFTAFNYLLAVVHPAETHFLTNLTYEGGAVVRVPALNVDRNIEDNVSNREFSEKRFKPIFKLGNQPQLDF